MNKWKVNFEVNDGEYGYALTITANSVFVDIDNENAFYADGVHIEIDGNIISVEMIGD